MPSENASRRSTSFSTGPIRPSRFGTLLAISVLALLAHAQTPSPLANHIAHLLADPAAARAHWGIEVTTLDGIPLYSLDAGKFFRPASTAKLFTAAAALTLLGPEATVTTIVTSTGTLDPDGTLHGDLVLHGAGDPNLSGRILPYAPKAHPGDPLAALDDLAAQVAAQGVRRIDGFVNADDTLWPAQPYAEAWSADDLPWGYGAPVTALVLNDNQWDLRLTPGPTVGAPATVTGNPAWLGIATANLTTGARDTPPHILITDEPTLEVSGTVPLNHPEVEEIALRNPAPLTATAFQDRLAAHGITSSSASGSERTPAFTNTPDPEATSGTASIAGTISVRPGAPTTITDRSTRSFYQDSNSCTASCRVLASRTSATLATDLAITLKTSQNLHAEMLGKRLGKRFGPDGTFEAGAAVVRAFLTQTALLDPTAFTFVDASGLSTHDLVTPHATVQLLRWAATQPWFPQFFAALPIGGVDGTLANRFPDPPLKAHVFAKTGTLGESRALAGYLDTPSGQRLLFAIFTDNHPPNSSADRTLTDRIVAAIAAAQ